VAYSFAVEPRAQAHTRKEVMGGSCSRQKKHCCTLSIMNYSTRFQKHFLGVVFIQFVNSFDLC
jgi:hypothetical protein